MKVILNRDIKNLGKVGDVYNVKDGYGRNFLLPNGYACIASKTAIEELNEKIDTLREKNDALFKGASDVAVLIENKVFNIVRQAADDGIMYGSVRNRDIYSMVVDFLKQKNCAYVSFNIGAIKISEPIKQLGRYIVNIDLFVDVRAKLRLNVCRVESDFESDVAVFDRAYEFSLKKDTDTGASNKLIAKLQKKCNKIEYNDTKIKSHNVESKSDKGSVNTENSIDNKPLE